MAQVKSFNPVLDTLILGGVQVTGFSDTKFTLTPTNNRATTTQGIDGDISVNQDSRFSGTLTINLLQNSDMCRILDAWILQVSIAGGTPFFPVSLASVSSNASLGTVGWVQDQAEYDVGQETGVRSYVIGVADSRLRPINGLGGIESIQAYAGTLGRF
jgi:hypothetical protein